MSPDFWSLPLGSPEFWRIHLKVRHAVSVRSYFGLITAERLRCLLRQDANFNIPKFDRSSFGFQRNETVGGFALVAS